jgi:hypothetical protein
MKKFTSFVLIFTLGLFANSVSANDYLIHKNDDSSIFTQGTSDTILKIVDQSGAGWKQYSDFLGNQNQWVWTDNTNQFWLYNESQESSYIFADLDAVVGTEYEIDFNDCTTKSQITGNDLTVQTIAGPLSNVIEVSFSGPCTDAGLTTALFAPGIGVISYGFSTIAGPITYQLDSAYIAGVHYQREQVSSDISIMMDYSRNIVMLDEQNSLDVFMTIKNNSEKDYVLSFNSSQFFDIELINNADQIIYSWAADKRFLQYINEVIIPAGGQHQFGAAIKLQDTNYRLLDVGSYIVKLTLKGGEKHTASSFSSMPLSVQFPIHVDQRMNTF